MFGIRKKQKQTAIIKEITGENGLQIAPFSHKNDFNLTQYKRLDGAALCAILPSIEPIFKSLNSSPVGAKTSCDLYRVILPKDAHLARVHGENAFIGSAVKDGKGVIGQARFIPASTTNTATTPFANGGSASALSVSAGLIIAVALLDVDKKLKDVRETGLRVLAFLETKERTRIEGNVEILNDIFDNYKYNLNNSLYKTNKHAQAQTIKSEAEQSIKLYRAQIDEELRKQTFLHANKNVEDKLARVERLNDCYKLALYCYSLAYFIEIMLFENFEPDYLNNVLATLERHKEQYFQLKTTALAQLEQYAGTSVQAYAVKAFEKIGSGASKLIAKIPAKRQKNKLLGAESGEKTSADATTSEFSNASTETSELPNELPSASAALNSSATLNSSAADTSAALTSTANSLAEPDDFITPFIENVKFIKNLRDGAEILMDANSIYVKA